MSRYLLHCTRSSPTFGRPGTTLCGRTWSRTRVLTARGSVAGLTLWAETPEVWRCLSCSRSFSAAGWEWELGLPSRGVDPSGTIARWAVRPARRTA